MNKEEQIQDLTNKGFSFVSNVWEPHFHERDEDSIYDQVNQFRDDGYTVELGIAFDINGVNLTEDYRKRFNRGCSSIWIKK